MSELFSNCCICGKPLTDPHSMKVGMGATCASRASTWGPEEELEKTGMIYMPEHPIHENGVILYRVGQTKSTNVPWLVIEGSPDGFEWGYPGSGPADLALNIVEAVLRSVGYQGEKTEAHKGTCYNLSMWIHQDIKDRFIVDIEREGGIIPFPQLFAAIKTLKDQTIEKDTGYGRDAD